MHPVLPRATTLLVLLACLTLSACAPGRGAPDSSAALPPPPASRTTLRIGVLRHAPPMSFYDAYGEMTGFAVDMARNVVQKITGDAARVVFVPLEKDERIPALRDNTVDVLFANLTPTPELAAQVLFAEPYIVSRLGVLSPVSKHVSALVQLQGRRLAVPMQSAAEAYFRKLGVPLVRVATTGEALAALRNGRADAAALENLTLAAWAAANTGYILGIPALGEKVPLAPAVRKNDPALAAAINTALATLEAEGFFLTAYNRHMPRYARFGLLPDMLFPALGALP